VSFAAGETSGVISPSVANGLHMGQTQHPWFVYLVRCSDGSIYTGITDNVDARLKKHNDGKGAKYTVGRRPVSLLYSELHTDQSSASRREAEIKTWRKPKKESLARAETGCS